MIKQSDETAAPLVLSKQTERTKARPAAKPRNTRATIALLIALLSVGLHFQPFLKAQFERAARSQPWIADLARQLEPMVPQLAGGADTPASASTLAASLPAADLGAGYEEVRASLVELGQAVERLEAAATGYVSADALADVRTELTELAQVQDKLHAEAAAHVAQVEAMVAEHDRRLAATQQSPMASLIVARLALVTANGAVSAHEVEQLSAVATLVPAVSETVATLKVLSGQDILSMSALRDQFLNQQEAALSAARSAQLEWWEAGLSSVQTTASDWGLARPQHHSKDDIAMENAAHRLDAGDLQGALFELEAASPEIKDALRLWLDQAQLRVTFDETLLQLVDGLIRQDGKPAASASSDG